MIRLLAEEDFALWKDIRLEAVRLHPEAFGGSFEEESLKSDGEWMQTLESGSVFAYLSNDKPVGTAGYFASRMQKKRHIGIVFTVYVREAFRGKGVMDWLMQALAYHARDNGVEQLHLEVGTCNASAIRCYERLGFIGYGTKPRALKIGSAYIDEHLMVKYL